MASSNVEMASTSKTNPDLPRESSVCSISTIIADLHHTDSSRNLVSMSMDDLLKNIYSDGHSHSHTQVQVQDESTIIGTSISLPKELNTRTVEEVWKEIVAGSDQSQRREVATDHEITLEDFLSKAGAGAAREDDVRVPAISEPGGYAVDSTTLNSQFQMPSQQQLEGAMVAYGSSGIEGRMVGVGRGKRRAVEEPVDKATQQKQRRMIKNRESAARSRERKQAYTLELESLVAQLEEENARLLREEVTICRLSTSRNGLSSSRRNSSQSLRSGDHTAFLEE